MWNTIKKINRDITSQELKELLPSSNLNQGVVFLRLDEVFSTYAGQFKVKPSNEKYYYNFLKIANDFFKEAYINDEIFLYHHNQEFRIFTKIKTNQYQDLIENKIVYLPDDKLISFKWNNQTNRWASWLELENTTYKLETIFINNAILDSKKLIRHIFTNNKRIEDEELNQMLNPEKPVIDVYMTRDSEGKKILPNALSELNIGNSKAPLSMSNLQDYWRWRADRLGWPTANEQKLERKTFAEGLIDLENTKYLQQQTINNLIVLSHEMKEKWNVNIEFIQTSNLNKEDLNSNQPNQEQGENKNELQ